MNRKPNLKDVAELAGVSAITVSRVLTHPDKVAAKSRQKVEQAIAELWVISATTPPAHWRRTAPACWP